VLWCMLEEGEILRKKIIPGVKDIIDWDKGVGEEVVELMYESQVDTE
jgi:hypothetical protein